MMKNNLSKFVVLFFVIGIISLTFITAGNLGVSTPYMEEINGIRTFQVYKNNAEDFEVVLQTGNELTNVRVEIVEGSEVIELIEENNIFLVNPGEKVPIKFRILAPPGAEIGDTFSVRVSFSSSDVGEGALAFGQAIEKDFNVLLVEMPVFASSPEDEKESGKVALIIFVSIIVLLILLIILIKVRKSQNQNLVKKPEHKNKIYKKESSSVKKKAVKRKK